MIERERGNLLGFPYIKEKSGRLAQLVRVLVSHTRGHWFKSSIAHQSKVCFPIKTELPENTEVQGASPTREMHLSFLPVLPSNARGVVA